MTPAARRKQQWAAVSWCKDDATVAREMGTGVAAVRYQRRKRQSRQPGWLEEVQALWRGMDWGLPVPQIAEMTGRSLSHVWAQRRKYKLEKP